MKGGSGKLCRPRVMRTVCQGKRKADWFDKERLILFLGGYSSFCFKDRIFSGDIGAVVLPTVVIHNDTAGSCHALACRNFVPFEAPFAEGHDFSRKSSKI